MAKIRITKKGKLDLSKKSSQLTKLVRRDLPKIVGIEGVNFSKKAFRRQGWQDSGFRKWKARKNKKDRGRAILVKSGDLRRSIKKQIGNKRVIISSNLIYAPVHNYGLRAGRGKGFKMPKRKFIGSSKALNIRIKKIIKKEVNKILN